MAPLSTLAFLHLTFSLLWLTVHASEAPRNDVAQTFGVHFAHEHSLTIPSSTFVVKLHYRIPNWNSYITKVSSEILKLRLKLPANRDISSFFSDLTARLDNIKTSIKDSFTIIQMIPPLTARHRRHFLTSAFEHILDISSHHKQVQLRHRLTYLERFIANQSVNLQIDHNSNVAFQRRVLTIMKNFDERITQLGNYPNFTREIYVFIHASLEGIYSQVDAFENILFLNSQVSHLGGYLYSTFRTFNDAIMSALQGKLHPHLLNNQDLLQLATQINTNLLQPSDKGSKNRGLIKTDINYLHKHIQVAIFMYNATTLEVILLLPLSNPDDHYNVYRLLHTPLIHPNSSTISTVLNLPDFYFISTHRDQYFLLTLNEFLLCTTHPKMCHSAALRNTVAVPTCAHQLFLGKVQDILKYCDITIETLTSPLTLVLQLTDHNKFLITSNEDYDIECPNQPVQKFFQQPFSILFLRCHCLLTTSYTTLGSSNCHYEVTQLFTLHTFVDNIPDYHLHANKLHMQKLNIPPTLQYNDKQEIVLLSKMLNTTVDHRYLTPASFIYDSFLQSQRAFTVYKQKVSLPITVILFVVILILSVIIFRLYRQVQHIFFLMSLYFPQANATSISSTPISIEIHEILTEHADNFVIVLILITSAILIGFFFRRLTRLPKLPLLSTIPAENLLILSLIHDGRNHKYLLATIPMNFEIPEFTLPPYSLSVVGFFRPTLVLRFLSKPPDVLQPAYYCSLSWVAAFHLQTAISSNAKSSLFLLNEFGASSKSPVPPMLHVVTC